MKKKLEKSLELLIKSTFAAVLSYPLAACDDAKSHDDKSAHDDVSMDTDSEDGSALFEADHIVEVDIEMNPEDWEALSNEGRSITSTVAGCQNDYEFTYFKADVTIDGKTIEDAGVRKKGYLGSLSRFRPSLKINFGKFIEDQKYINTKQMTLNNDRQDASHTHQVMSYALFSKAGVVAPRANFAKVTVNGEDLGTYSNVEPIKKPFLARHFDDDSGNLYEAQVADFTPELVSRFQKKTNEDDVIEEGNINISDLEAVIDALKAEDSELLEALGKVIDVDNFLTFWAMEVILGHWDGYSGNRNNYYIYRDPSSNLFSFIPWGTDFSFEPTHIAKSESPVSVYALGTITYRLYNYPKTRARYHERLKGLLGELWDEAALLAEVDRIEKLTAADSAVVEKQREFIKTRKDLILDDIIDEGPEWPYPFESETKECREITDISGNFSSKLGTGQDFVPGEDLTITLGGEDEPEALSEVLIAATIGESPGMGEAVQIIMLAPRESGNNLLLILYVSLDAYKKGELPLHGFETTGMVLDTNLKTGSFDVLGYVSDGTITIDEAGLEDGDIVSGSFVGRF
jgi:spore coat protein H